jgi:signal transduction histidine kinase
MLYEFINLNRDKIIARCRGKVAVRSIPLPTESEINHGVPMFLDHLVEALWSGAVGSAEIDSSASQHGRALLRQGFAVSQVVHDYDDICQSITELAIETCAPISTEEFRTLNRCLDEAIESAVTMYARERQRADSEKATDRENERLGFLVHELRNLVNTAVVAFQVLKTGNVGVGGSTGAVLDRSLISLRGLIGRSLDEIRLTNAMKNRRPIRVSTFIQEVGASATLDANARQLRFVVVPYADESVTIEVDDQVLAAVVANLLQNAFKFTRPGTTVTLRVVGSADRCSSKCTTNVAACPERASRRNWQRRSNSEAPTAPVSASGLRSVDGAPRPMAVACTRGTCRVKDASSPWICRAPPFQSRRSFNALAVA